MDGANPSKNFQSSHHSSLHIIHHFIKIKQKLSALKGHYYFCLKTSYEIIPKTDENNKILRLAKETILLALYLHLQNTAYFFIIKKPVVYQLSMLKLDFSSRYIIYH